MEVIIPVIFISAIVTYSATRVWKINFILIYILLAVLMNTVFYVQGYLASGYIDPFVSIGVFFLSLTILFGCVLGKFIGHYLEQKNSDDL